MQLLPKDKDISWLPYAYLVYLSFFVVYPLLTRAGALELTLMSLGIIIFLPLYFLSYWVDGPKLLAVIAGMTALGVAYGPFNPGASVFFIYGAAAGAFAGSATVAWSIISAIVAVLGVESLVLRLPGEFWIPGVAFSVFVGALNIHAAQRKAANAKLRLAYDEIERLAKVAERERIARDLHDLLGHTLSLIVLKSELAGKLLEHDPARARQEIRELEQVSRNALSEVRQAVRGYRAGNLASEVARAKGTLETAGVAVECHVDPVSLSGSQENVMALALREAVTNVVRHANATQCTICVRVSDGQCAMEVIDNGRGGVAQEGNGLRGMRERAEALGGTVTRCMAEGFSVAVSLPLRDGEHCS
ncbi:MAG TPA: sensor histidine kinase [Candidatus Angelobacter sp.]|nr:sensor histidine kinase [Candidatus Angelobacter sp.]